MHKIINDDVGQLGLKELGVADLVYLDPPFNTNRDFDSFNDQWGTIDNYIEYMIPRLAVCINSLKPDGNFLIHTDYRTSHYLRVLLDGRFGYDNLMNEIIWQYNSGGAAKTHLARKHDTILWYVADRKNYTFNILREPYATPDVQNRPGFHPDGRMLTDVWNIPFLSTTAKERTGYPTQKPLALMERILEVFTNPGDTVIDGFAGSGTTGVAAEKLDRNSVLVDENPAACELIEKRLA